MFKKLLLVDFWASVNGRTLFVYSLPNQGRNEEYIHLFGSTTPLQTSFTHPVPYLGFSLAVRCSYSHLCKVKFVIEAYTKGYFKDNFIILPENNHLSTCTIILCHCMVSACFFFFVHYNVNRRHFCTSRNIVFAGLFSNENGVAETEQFKYVPFLRLILVKYLFYIRMSSKDHIWMAS